MRTSEKGFTLIELIVVIVILGILAAVAIPKYSDLSTAARTASAQGMCGALASSAVLLYASNKGPTSGVNVLGNTSYSSTDYSAVTNTGSPAAGCQFVVTATGGTPFSCTVVGPNLCNAN